MRRGVGFCENTPCEDYAKGVYLLNHNGDFHCPRCRELGLVELESGAYEGNSEIFKTVRVEFSFSPTDGKYHEIAIVADESLKGHHNTYTLQSPLIKTQTRALKVAEAILGNLNRSQGISTQGEIPTTAESCLSFDQPREQFLLALGVLRKTWEESALRDRAYTEAS